jgi:hypothetical protein
VLREVTFPPGQRAVLRITVFRAFFRLVALEVSVEGESLLVKVPDRPSVSSRTRFQSESYLNSGGRTLGMFGSMLKPGSGQAGQ